MLKDLYRPKNMMSVKLDYLSNPLEEFLKNLGGASDEQGESFHQDIESTG